MQVLFLYFKGAMANGILNNFLLVMRIIILFGKSLPKRNSDSEGTFFKV